MSTQTRIPEGLPGRFFEYAIADPAQRRRIAAAVGDGEPAAEVAARYGISTRTVRRYAAELGRDN